MSGRAVVSEVSLSWRVQPFNLKPEFEKNHDLHWGKMYKPQDVKIEWHCEQIATH